MTDLPELELVARREDGGPLRLCSPAVGLFTAAEPKGRVLVPGQGAGVLLVLGRAQRLVVPAAAAGQVLNERPERVHAPVGYLDVLYELGDLEGVAAQAGPEDPSSAAGTGGLLLRSPQSGRFYHRTSPDAPPLAQAGAELAEGDPVGLIEVMKTFATVPYRARGGLPPRARVVRLLAGDGSDVAEGQPLLEVEPL